MCYMTEEGKLPLENIFGISENDLSIENYSVFLWPGEQASYG